MPFTVCTMTLSANALGTKTSTQIATQMDKTKIPADLDYLDMLGASIKTDTSGHTGTVATRVFELWLNKPRLRSSFQNNPQANEFQGCIVSESDEDSPSGQGAQTVTLNYLDAAGTPHAESGIALKGTIAVGLTNKNHFELVSLDITAAAGGLANAGRIKIFTGLPARPPPILPYAPGPPRTTGTCVAVLPQPAYRLVTNPALPSQLSKLFANYMRRKIWAKLGIPILATAPVFS